MSEFVLWISLWSSHMQGWKKYIEKEKRIDTYGKSHHEKQAKRFFILMFCKRGRRCGVVQGRCLITDLHSDLKESNDRWGRLSRLPRINHRRVPDDRTCKLHDASYTILSPSQPRYRRRRGSSFRWTIAYKTPKLYLKLYLYNCILYRREVSFSPSKVFYRMWCMAVVQQSDPGG